MAEAFADPAAITGYHAHLYYAPETRPIAERLRAAIGERFPQARIGSWHDEPVGPHPVSMYQVAFAVEEFPLFVPWLMLNRRRARTSSCTRSPKTASRITRGLRCGSARLCRCASRCCGKGRGPAEAGPRPLPRPLYAAHYQQHDDDDQDNAEPAARIVSPPAAIPPGRQRADQQDDQNDQKDRAQGRSSTSAKLLTDIQPWGAAS